MSAYRFCVAVVLSLLLVPSAALAQRVTNNSNDAAGSLRDVLARASSGDTITFDPSLAGALINLVTPDSRTLGSSPAIPLGATALVVDGIDVTIDGSAAPGLQIDGASARRVFVVVNGGRLTLRNVTVQNGRALGGDGGSPGGGGGGGFGGGVFVADGSTLMLDGVTMLQNTARGGAGARGGIPACGGGGGGIANLPEGNGSASVTPASGAGGLPNPGSASTDVGHFGGDGGGGSGGCVTFTAGGDALLQAGGDGGWGAGGGGCASYFSTGPRVLRRDRAGAGGFGGGGGGGWGTSRFVGGASQPVPAAGPAAPSAWGGGSGGTNTLEFSSASGAGGGGAGLGGAVFVRGGLLIATRSTFVRNESVGGPSPVGLATSGTSGLGRGAVFVVDGSITITESTFSGNVGGAVYALGLASEGHLSVGSSVLAGSSGADCGYDRRGWFNSLGNNLVENAGVCVVLASDRAGDPMLGALADNGGPTMTMLPTSTSPVFGNGMCALATDQRGRMRNTPCDIGAVDADRVALSDAGIDGAVDGGVVEDSGSATLDASTDDAGMLDAGTLADDAMASLDSGTQDDAGAVDSGAVPADSGSLLRDASVDAFGTRDAARADGSVTDLDAGAPPSPQPQSSCGCRVTRTHNASWWLAACALGLMIARRKKRASS